MQWTEDHRIPKGVMIWNPLDRRGQGRPRDTWMNEITQIMCKELLQDR